jgi:hypothetical protein
MLFIIWLFLRLLKVCNSEIVFPYQFAFYLSLSSNSKR